MDISFGPLLFLLALVAVPYLLLSLTDRRSLGARVGQCLAAGAVGLTLVLLAVRAHHGEADQPRPRAAVPTVAVSTIDAEAAVQLAARAAGGWLVLIGVGELLRVGLKRRAGVELLEPAALLLAGVLLFRPHWSVGVALAVDLLAVVALHIWDRRTVTQPEPAAGP